jgi:ribonuclease P protein component
VRWRGRAVSVSFAGSVRRWRRERTWLRPRRLPGNLVCPKRVAPPSRTREKTEGYEAHLPAQPYSAPAQARVPITHEDGPRPQRPEAATGEGPEAARAHDTFEVTVATGTGRFRRSDRLRNSRDYRRVSSNSARVTSREFVMLVATAGPEPTGSVRLGITASRKVGNAVVRNRVKRSVRQWFRTRRRGIAPGPEGLDMVVIARRAASRLNPLEIAERLDGLVQRYARNRA